MFRTCTSKLFHFNKNKCNFSSVHHDISSFSRTTDFSDVGLYIFTNSNLNKNGIVKIGVSTDLTENLDKSNGGKYINQYLLYDNELLIYSMYNIRIKLLIEFNTVSILTSYDKYFKGFIKLQHSNDLNTLKKRIKEELHLHNIKYYEF